MISKRLGTLGIVAVLSASLLSGCKPPEQATSTDIGGSEGRKIINIPAQMESRGKYKIQEIDGTEYLVARGEVVVVEDKLGVTMTEIVKSDRS